MALNVMKWARRIKIEKILFLSSGAVYGETTETDRFSETNLSAPQLGAQGSVYGESKLCRDDGTYVRRSLFRLDHRQIIFLLWPFDAKRQPLCFQSVYGKGSKA